MSETWNADLQDILSDTNIPWNLLKNSTILITGATGLIGSALAHALIAANKHHHLSLQLIFCGRNKIKGEELFLECKNTTFICGDIRNPKLFATITDNIDFIFHCAAVTKSADMVSNPVDVMTTSVNGTHNLLKLARIRNCCSFVYVSSMEVYGQNLSGIVTEKDLGFLDFLNPRSSYPESKRFCEMLCVSYTKQYNMPIKIARLAQTFGAGTSINDTRVFAQFARSKINGENIILHTEGLSRGNYCYTADAIRGLITLLLKGNDGEIYNISNPATSMTIREMAELVATKIGDSKGSVIINIPHDAEKLGYAPITKYKLSADKISALGWLPKYGLTEMYQRLIDDWRN